MKNSKKRLTQKVYAECSKAVIVPALLHTAAETAAVLLLIFSADILGKFADAAFQLNWNLGVDNALRLAACVFATVVLVPGINWLSDFIMLKKSLQHDCVVFGHYLDKEPEKARQLDAGEMQYELEDAPITLRNEYCIIAGKAVALPVGLAVLLFFSGRISWLLTGLMFLLAAIRLFVPTLLQKRVANYDVRVKQYEASRRAYETDLTSQIHLLRLWRIEKSFLSRLKTLYQNHFESTEKGYLTCQTWLQRLPGSIDQLTQLLLFLAGALMVAADYVTLGQLTSVLVFLSVTQTLLQFVGSIIQEYPLMKNAAERVGVIYQDAENRSGEKVESFKEISGCTISVSFDERQVISDFSFHVNAGAAVCLVGKNGSGKSTLCQIISGMHNSYEGMVYVNGIDLRTLCMPQWREQFSYAAQNPYVFSTTVRENISMAAQDASGEEINEVMDMLHILSMADREIGADTELSGGERQKISLARALVRKTPLLILDEPTNHLDKDSIAALVSYLEHCQRTVIAVSHDPLLLQALRQIAMHG